MGLAALTSVGFLRTCSHLLLIGLMSSMLMLGGCKRPKTYPQGTPDETVQSAVQMVKDGQAKQLSRLIYAESPEMKSVLDRLGVLFGNLQVLSKAAAARWPDELAKLQAKALEDSKSDTGVLAGLLAGNAPRRRSGGGPAGADFDPDAVRNAFNSLLADPYSWLERNSSRLSALKIDDDTASILLDGQPVIPVVGLPMRRDGSKWYIAIPNNMPPMNTVWPRTREQWAILGSLIKVLDNAVVALTADVESGKLRSVKELVDGLQEKAMFPAIMAFGAYGREMDVRQRVDRRLQAFRTKLRAWVKYREETPARDASGEPRPGVSRKVLETIEALAPGELEKLVRTSKPSAFDKMTEPEFEEMLNTWFANAKLGVKAEGVLVGQSVEETIKAWNVAREKERKAKPMKQIVP
jgi:hypothetical protein